MAAIHYRPVILVAHSLGSLVVYSYLEGHIQSCQPFDVRQVVTIGSMLSLPEVYRSILGVMVNSPIPWPDPVRDWTNIRDPRDPLAFQYGGLMVSGLIHQYSEILLSSSPGGMQAHDAGNYLRNPTTAKVILGAWCKALRDSQATEPGCS